MSKDRKQKIINAANSVIDKQGLHNTTVQAILDEADISKGGLYHHYKSKNAILYDVLAQEFIDTIRMTNKVAEGETSPEEIRRELAEVMDSRFAKTTQNKLQSYLIFEAVLGDDQELRHKLIEQYDSWIERLKNLLIYAYDSPLSPYHESMAIILLATIDGLLIQDLLYGEKFSRGQIVRTIDHFFKLELNEFFHKLAALDLKADPFVQDGLPHAYHDSIKINKY